MEGERYTPLYSSEAAPLRVLSPRIEKLIGRKIVIDGVLERNQKEEPTRVWRIKLSPENPDRKVATALLTDWDDTLEPYTQRKEALYSSYRDLVPDLERPTQKRLIDFCKSLNQAARILPVSSAHPEKYSPFVEVFATSQLFQLIKSDPEALKMLEQPSEEAARNFIRQYVLPHMEGKLEIKNQTKDGKEKVYFRETTNQAAAIDFDHQPFGVVPEVWDRFKKAMTQANIPDHEYPNFDLDETVYWAISTFGEVNFQLEKIINTLAQMKEKGIRLPDEIVLFTRGRKEPVIKSMTEEWVKKAIPVIYIDDSVSQLKKVVSFPEEFGGKFIALRAQRALSKRSTDPTPEGIRDVYMGHQTLSSIVKWAFK